jgi:MFS family permease
VIADRYPKRQLLTITQTTMGALAALLAVLDATDSVQVWQVDALAFALGLVTAVDNPARQSFVVELVGVEDLPNAVGLNSATFNVGRMLGPALAGFLVAGPGTAVACRGDRAQLPAVATPESGGPLPSTGWRVLVCHRPADQVALSCGSPRRNAVLMNACATGTRRPASCS